MLAVTEGACHELGGRSGGQAGGRRSTRRGKLVRAFLSEQDEPPETLRLAEVAKPAPRANAVLVKVLAISVNPADWHCLRGEPLFSRATLGLLRPKNTILGGDIAGEVEAVGDGVTGFQPGD